MKILMVHPEVRYDNTEIVIINLANYLTDQGHSVDILTKSISYNIEDQLHNVGINTITLPEPGKISTINIVTNVKVFNEWIKNHDDYEIIIVYGFPSELMVKGINAPVIWLCNEVKEEIVDEKVSFPKSLIVKSLNKSLFKQEVEIVNNHVKEIIIADQYTQRQVEWKYHVHNTIVPYGVDCDFFSQGTPEVIEERYHLFMHFVIVQNDFFTPNRNQLELVKIVEKIHERTPSLSLLLIGNDETKYANVVKKYVDDRKIDFVTFVGDVPRELIRDIYSAADVCVFPGRGGIWLSPLEAICSGVPTIYTAMSPASDFMMNNKLGIVAVDIESAIFNIHSRADLFTSELKVQQDYIKAKFTWDSFCKSVLEILKQHRRHVF